MTELTPTIDADDRRAARGHVRLALIVLALLAGIFVSADVCERHDQWLLHRRLVQWRLTNGSYFDGRYFDNPEERLLYHSLPSHDFSRGGVWFFGSSPTQQAVLPWEFPADIRPRVENFSMAGANHNNERRFMRCLIDHHGLLAAGGDKSLVVIELLFGSACHDRTPVQQYMQDVWDGYFTRYGMYYFGADGEILPTEMTPLECTFKSQSLRSHVFLSWLLRHENNWLKPPEHAITSEILRYWSDRFGPNWEAGMDAEIAELSAAIDYLQARHANVAGLYFPQRQWARDYRPAIRYRQRVMALMAAKSVQVIDLRDSFDESEFADSVHLNYVGSMKLQPRLIELAQRQLQ
ncbi:MAG TPA: hypothetical protein VLI90_04230 [Tepidisphaeraceae bacterium]|nr:hypothetical protein [Tepidisphaeraceae bacterium]